MPAGRDRRILRDLARRWVELAAQPVMEERRRLWRSVHDLKAERPVFLIETSSIEGFVAASGLACTEPFPRAVERHMRETIRHGTEVGDDIVVEPYYRIGWQVRTSGFGVPQEMHRGRAGDGTTLGYAFDHPIATPEQIERLQKRRFAVDREATRQSRSTLDDLMGDILPTRLGNYDPFHTAAGDEGKTGLFFFGPTWQVFRFIGNQGLLLWPYDAPQALHRLMTYMAEDRLDFFQFLQDEDLLVANTDNQTAGPRSYGYVSDLPGVEGGKGAALADLWGWAESQETTGYSPRMFRDFVLPYLAAVASRFGLVYYGCCEPLTDRLEAIIAAIPNLRSVSISGWSDFARAAELLGRRYVYSRKPVPAFLSGPNPDWGLAAEDLKKTYTAARDCHLEILLRDLYTIGRDGSRLSKWVAMARSIFRC